MKKDKNEKKQNGFVKFLLPFILLAAGAVCGYLVMEYAMTVSFHGTNVGKYLLAVGLLLLVVVAAMYLQTLIHEGGHLLFGLMTGYRFVSFRVGSWMLLRRDGKLSLKKIKIAGTGGQCLLSPPDMKDGKIPYVLYNLGGSICNLAVGLLCLVALFLLPEGDPLLATLLLMMAVTGIATALLNGIPMHTDNVDNDGMNTLNLSRDPNAVTALWVQLRGAEQNTQGKRTKDMPEEWFVLPENANLENGMIAYQAAMACERLVDELRLEEAKVRIEELLEKKTGLMGISRNLLICNLACCELLTGDGTMKSRRLWTKDLKAFLKAMKDFPVVMRTEYIIALLRDQDPEKAEAVLKRFDNSTSRYPYPVDLLLDRELMEMARQKMTEKENGA